MTDSNQKRDQSKLWYLALGAMLASRDVRTSTSAKIPLDDVPKEVAGLWRCVTNGDGRGVRQIFVGLGVDVWDDGVLPSLLRHLQEQAMGELCQRLIARAEVTRLQTPEALRDKFVKMASLMDSRIASLEKSRAEGREAAAAAADKLNQADKNQNGSQLHK